VSRPTAHARASSILLDTLFAAGALLRDLPDRLQSSVFLLNAIFDPRLIRGAGLPIVERAIAWNACLGTALLAFADVWIDHSLGFYFAKEEPAALLGLLRFGFHHLWLVHPASAAFWIHAPSPAWRGLPNVFALHFLEPGELPVSRTARLKPEIGHTYR